MCTHAAGSMHMHAACRAAMRRRRRAVRTPYMRSLCLALLLYILLYYLYLKKVKVVLSCTQVYGATTTMPPCHTGQAVDRASATVKHTTLSYRPNKWIEICCITSIIRAQAAAAAAQQQLRPTAAQTAHTHASLSLHADAARDAQYSTRYTQHLTAKLTLQVSHGL
jgi:hypothetical protein